MITDAQRNLISEYLASQGLTFQPLLDEMTDHICSEAEEMMSRQMKFEEALQLIITDLPQGHFKNIQSETMKTITNKFNLSRAFSFVAMGAVLIATIFKILMLPGAPEILMIGFAALGAALISGVLPGLTVKREEKGVIRVVAIVASIIFLLFGYAFIMMHLPGANQLKILAVLLAISAIVMNTMFVHNNSAGRGNLMTHLHEKHSPGIERFLLFLLTPVTLYKTIWMFRDGRGSVVDVILIIVIYLAGLQLISFFWRSMEKGSGKGALIAILTIVAGICLNLPMLGELVPFQARLLSVTLFSVVSAAIVYQLGDDQSKAMAFFPPVIFVVLALMRVHVLPVYSNTVINVIVIAMLIASIFIARKNEMLRTYMIVSLASFLIEYNLSVTL
ncbi:MAG TPA: hypothetical protein VFE50_09305 [Cyclobacteriaceae bacterium]|nr:hypothetical protein [Cyclobacteriaceae bacterium]